MGIPRVSVLLPARDAAVTLGACLRSLCRQTLTDWECVVVDDGSRDGTGELAAAADPRIRVVTLPPSGVVAAANAGLGHCRARYIARMDADDVMHRDRLALQVAALDADATIAAVGAHVRFFPRREMTDGLRAYERWLNGIATPQAVRADAFVESPVANPTLCMRADVLRTFRWEDHGWPEDYDLILRLLAAGHEIGMIPRRLLAWRDGPGRLTRTHSAYAQDRIVACKAHHLATGFLAATDRYVLWGYGGTGRALRRALALHGRHPSHVVELHAGRLGNRIHGAPVIGPDALDDLPRGRLVASVAGAPARSEIRAFLTARGWVETCDFVCAA